MTLGEKFEKPTFEALEPQVLGGHFLIFTAYDQIFVWLVVTPIFAGTWRGTWGNADSLIDTVIFNGDLVGSAFFCLFAGLALSSILMFRLETIECFAKSGGR